MGKMYGYLRKVNETITDQVSERFRILVFWSYKFNLVVNVFLVMSAITYFTLLVYPFVWYRLTGEVETTLPIMLPFVDEKTTKGYIICVVVESVYVVIAALGFLASDLSYAMLALYTWPLVDLFSDHLEGMNVALRTDRKLGETIEMREYFSHIVQLHYVVMG